MRTVATGKRYERLLLTDSHFSLIFPADGEDILRYEPELAVVPPREAEAIAARTLFSPPRLLVIGERAALCDRCLPENCSDSDFLREARRAAAILTPALARKTEQARRAALEGLFEQLQMPVSLAGRGYLLRAADMLAVSPFLRGKLTTDVYPAVAREAGVSPAAVERAMRTAVEHVFLRGSMEKIALLFGMTIDPERGKPTNGEFLSMLAEHAKNQFLRENNV